ncbi:MAG: hypothetical protein HN348_31505, partial [Proteobacteria bacterium]|nr:hypothetical protein [Pseudomonadota bacterium]
MRHYPKAIISAAFLGLIPGEAVATTTCDAIVGPSQAHTTIKSAIAAVSPGATVCINNGPTADFSESLVIEKDITFVGTNGTPTIGPPLTVVEALITCDGAALTIENITLVGGDNRILKVNDCPTIVKNVKMGGCSQTDDGGCIYAHNMSSLTLEEVIFSVVTTTSENGGLVYLNNSVLTANNMLFDNGNAGGHGGAVYGWDSDMTFSDVEFQDNAADGNGGAIYAAASVAGTSLKLTNVAFSSNVANRGNHLETDNVDVEFLQGSADSLATSLVYDLVLTNADRVVLHDLNLSGPVKISDVVDAEVDAVMWCNVDSALLLEGVTAAEVHNSFFIEGATHNIDVESGTTAKIRNNHFLGANLCSHALIVDDTSVANTYNNIVVGYADMAMTTSVSASLFVDYTLFEDNLFGNHNGTEGTDVVEADPLLRDFIADGDCGETFGVYVGSPTLEAGKGLNPDNTTAHLGALGGPDALQDLYTTSADGDTSPVVYDCDDDNSNILPGAIDLCNDGIDADCDGADDNELFNWY